MASRPVSIAGALLTLLVVLSAGCLEEAAQPYNWEGVGIAPVEAEDFTLIDQNDTNFTLSDLEGKTLVVTFTYTQCPDICHLIEANLLFAKESLPADVLAEVAFVSVTVDPENDTTAALRAYMDERGFDWPHLTGDRATLETVWSDWWVGVADDPDANRTDAIGDIGHTGIVWLVDDDFDRRVYFAGTSWQPPELAADIERIVTYH